METQPAPGGRPPDEHLRLGQYLVGALPPAEREAFETHLARCRECLAEAERLEPMLTMLALVPPEEAHALVEAYAPPEAPGAPRRPRNDPPRPAEAVGSPTRTRSQEPREPREAPTRREPARPGPERPRGNAAGGPTRPTRGPAPRPSAGRPKAKRKRTGRLLVGALALVLVLSGIGVGWSIMRNGGVPAGDVTLAATAAEVSGGVSLSVRVVGNGRTSTVTATVGGLPAGERHQLFAVATSGQTHLLSDWTAAAGVQEVSGECDTPVEDLSFFTVRTLTGTSLVNAYINKGRPATSGQPASPR